LIKPPENSKPGDRVYFEGPEFESQPYYTLLERIKTDIWPDSTPLSQLNPKKKIFETIQPGEVVISTF
jgi:aminoacyl tRNA synthase complex-interacting multifunctional protein 1